MAELWVAGSAVREVIPLDPRFSARWHAHDYPGPFARWNYHPEYEIHYARRRSGRYIVGDSVGLFDAGQLVLIGPNVPHDWITDLAAGESISQSDLVFQFRQEWLTQCEAAMPEAGALQALWRRSLSGIEFTGDAARRGIASLEAIGPAVGADRLAHIFSLFGALSTAPAHETRTLARQWVPPVHDPLAAEIVGRSLDYILENISGTVRLGTAATLAGMSESAFSRYFTRSSGQNFTALVRKLRLAHAAKLLQQTGDPVARIALAVGYENLSNFNRQFLRELGETPTQYRARVRGASRPE
ncbi:AraC family transcriptional regulator [Cryobacterium frigoriphilum]|uniref:AraC family transcriptional regulator n=1 Tax=Cryobacterium frigoriphilum TaxID=1259150 RepID=A0A4R9A4R1_9MICO|nr:AraC family transcriptional regulator [Cryobacterium frigoriphilum]TFD52258.1 AraC family transcriptional regulator [Cryobacterium frigoriphilum]